MFKNNGTPININRMIIFGDTNSVNQFATNVELGGVISDDKVLLRNSHINGYTMNDSETKINEDALTGFIVDPINTTASSYTIGTGNKIYIEPTIHSGTVGLNRYVCMRAIYIELSRSSDVSITFSVTDLNSGKTVSTSDSSIWSSGSAIIMLNNAGLSTFVSEKFIENYDVLPKYREYYESINELSQYPISYKRK